MTGSASVPEDDADESTEDGHRFFDGYAESGDDWFFGQVKDRPVGGVPKRLRQSFEFVPGSVRESKDPVTH